MALLQGNLHGKSEKKNTKVLFMYSSLPPNQNILAGVPWGKSPSINGTALGKGKCSNIIY